MDYNELFDIGEVNFHFASGSDGNAILNNAMNKSGKKPYNFVKEICELVEKYPAIPIDSCPDLLEDIALSDTSGDMISAYEGVFVDKLQNMLINNKEVIIKELSHVNYGVTEEFFDENVYNKANLRNCMKDKENKLAEYIVSELWGMFALKEELGFDNY